MEDVADAEAKKLWCGGCHQEHDEDAFYRDADGEPYGWCRKARSAAAKRRRERQAVRLERLEAAQRLIVETLTSLVAQLQPLRAGGPASASPPPGPADPHR